MSQQDDIEVVCFMRRQPILFAIRSGVSISLTRDPDKHYSPATELVPSNFHISSRLISRIDPGIHLVRLSQHVCQQTMYMRGEMVETGFGAIESMDIDEEQSAFSRLGR